MEDWSAESGEGLEGFWESGCFDVILRSISCVCFSYVFL